MSFLRISTLSLVCMLLLISPGQAYAQSIQQSISEPTRAILMNPVIGAIPKHKQQAVKLLVVSGKAKGCIVKGGAYLSNERQRHEFLLEPTNCIKNGKKIPVGTVVRGQHNILGTMANSGMGRKHLISNKGVTVTLANH